MNKELEGLAKYMQQIQKSKQAFYLYLMDESIKNPHHIDPSYHPSVVAFNICREIQKIPFSYPEYVRPYHTPKELDAKKLREISLGIKAYRKASSKKGNSLAFIISVPSLNEGAVFIAIQANLLSLAIFFYI